MEQTEVILELQGIRKGFGEVEVLEEVNLMVHRGEFITILGPSGCGKTTLLRIIAGLESPDAGKVLLAGQDVTQAEPNLRDVNTVFQSYALFPHMNVFGNIAYSLKLKRVKKEEIRRRVEEMLALVQLEGFENRMPGELSGGQRQRVAIARAVINRPSVLLLDEPLGALDLQLRRQMQVELKRLQKRLGITFIYITHDQEEAINMSDRIVVMNNGRPEQIGTPGEIYDTPKTSFVAGFIGTANLLEGFVESLQNGIADIALPGGSHVQAAGQAGLHTGQCVTLCIRSENLLVATQPPPGFSLQAKVLEHNYAGGLLHLVLALPGGEELVATRHGLSSGIEMGREVFVGWQPSQAVLVDLDVQKEV